MIVRHYDTVQAERAATTQVRVLTSTVLRDALARTDFEPSLTPQRRAELDRLFQTHVLDEGFVRASLLAPEGIVTYSTDHRFAGSRGGSPAHVGEARGGTIRGDVTSIPTAGETLKVLRTFAPVAVPNGTGVVVLYQDYAPIARAANAAFLPVAGIFQAALLLLFLALVPILRRVTQRIRRQMDEIEHRAHYDALTGLPNRTLFRSLTEASVERAARENGTAVVLLLDVDRFKEVNDALGHERGDLLLQELGSRLHALCSGSVVARLGGDEFAILQSGGTEVEATVLAARIHEALEEPFDLDGFSLEAAASIGVAAYPEHGDRRRHARPARRRRHVRGEGRARRHVRLRPGTGHERRGASRARGRAAPGDRDRRARRLLPAEGRPRDRPDRRRRGARPLGAPHTRLHPARPVHPDRRAHRADQAAEPLRAGNSPAPVPGLGGGRPRPGRGGEPDHPRPARPRAAGPDRRAPRGDRRRLPSSSSSRSRRARSSPTRPASAPSSTA